MKKLLLANGETLEAEDAYAMRLIEQGQATAFAPEMPEESEKAEEPAATETKEAPKKKGK